MRPVPPRAAVSGKSGLANVDLRQINIVELDLPTLVTMGSFVSACAGIVERCKFGNICSGNERFLTRAGNDNCADVRTLAKICNQMPQVVQDLRAQRIQFVRSIYGNRCNVRFYFDKQRLILLCDL